MCKKRNKTIAFPINKRLGQNFLFNKNYLQKIVNSCSISCNTLIIEIGSGYGSLTSLLEKTDCKKIISYEKDKNLFQWLKKKKSDKITYLNSDALLINWREACLNFEPNSVIVVGNLPYYITNSLIVNLLFNYHLFSSFVFLVQKEVGQKWTSNSQTHPNKYSFLSVFINYLAEVKVLLNFPRQAFVPFSSVEGSLVTINLYKKNISQDWLTCFFKFLKICFHRRRRTLLNNLNNLFNNLLEEKKIFVKNKLKLYLQKKFLINVRPQELNSKDYWDLFVYWENIKAIKFI